MGSMTLKLWKVRKEPRRSSREMRLECFTISLIAAARPNASSRSFSGLRPRCLRVRPPGRLRVVA